VSLKKRIRRRTSPNSWEEGGRKRFPELPYYNIQTFQISKKFTKHTKKQQIMAYFYSKNEEINNKHSEETKTLIY
jgi:hypothetical protein